MKAAVAKWGPHWAPMKMEQPAGAKIYFEDCFDRKWLFHNKGRYAACFDISPERWRIFVYDLFVNSTFLYLDCPGLGLIQRVREIFYTFYWFEDFLVVLHGPDSNVTHLIFKVDHIKRNVQVIEPILQNKYYCQLQRNDTMRMRQSLTPTDYVVVGEYEFIVLIRAEQMALIPRNPFIKGISKQLWLNRLIRYGGFSEFYTEGRENIQEFPLVEGSSLYSTRIIRLQNHKIRVYTDRMIKIDLSKIKDWSPNIEQKTPEYCMNTVTQEVFKSDGVDVIYTEEEHINRLSIGHQVTFVKEETGENSQLLFSAVSKKSYRRVDKVRENSSLSYHPWGTLLKISYKEAPSNTGEMSYEIVFSPEQPPICTVPSLKNLAKIRVAFVDYRRMCEQLTLKQANVLFFK